MFCIETLRNYWELTVISGEKGEGEMLIDHDLHIHTTLSTCCQDPMQTPQEIIRSCERLGLRTIGFTDHVWQNPHLKPDAWYAPQGPVRFNSLNSALAQIETPLRVLRGCEADTLAPGKYSITSQFAETLDYVILAANHFHMKRTVSQPAEFTPAGVGKHMLLMFRSAVQSGFATIIPHVLIPMGWISCYDRAIAAISDTQLLDTFHLAAAAGVGIEITPSYLPPEGSTTEKWSIETPVRVLSLAKLAGCRFVFGSDAHSIDRLEQVKLLDYFVRELDLTGNDIHPIAGGSASPKALTKTK